MQPNLPSLVRRWTLFVFTGLIQDPDRHQHDQEALHTLLVRAGAAHLERGLSGWHFDASTETVDRLTVQIDERWRIVPFRGVRHSSEPSEHPLLESLGREDGVFMVTAGLDAALRFARALGERLEALGRPVQPTVGAVRGHNTSGLLFQNDITGRRARVMTSTTSGSCRIYLGEFEDFDPATQVPLDDREPLDVDVDDPADLLRAADLTVAFLRT